MRLHTVSRNQSESSPPPLLFISTLGVNLSHQSRKEVESITLRAGRVTREIRQVIFPGRGHEESFDPPLEVLFNECFSVSVHYRKTFRGAVTFSVDPQEILSEAKEEDGQQLYRKVDRKVELVVGIQSLPSTVSETVASCSRFRVLIIGKSGVGKSSLINKVFGVAGVDVSNTTRGRASIDQEYVASDNERFIVHDSCGFEAADQKNLTAARDFISCRRRMRDLRDQLHAVWLCLAIPFAGGRLIEAGVEDFLKNRREILGNIPLVVVFTKLDLLVNTLDAEALKNGEALDDLALKEHELESLERLCLRPVRAGAGSDGLLHVAVSTTDGYEESLAALVDVTTKNIQKYVKDEAAHYIATIAQRVNISLKIALTISVGEKRYWKALTASPNFRNRSIKACLHVIHKDIITVWNFNNPDNSLQKDDFKECLLRIPNLRIREIEDIRKTTKTSVTVVAALVTIIASVAGTGGAALPIIVPIAGAAILGKLAHNLYRASQDVVKQFMAYIVDLTCVMQIIFLLASTRNGMVNVEVVAIAMRAYEETHRSSVHTDINKFSVNLAVAPGKRDHVLDKIKELINSHSVGDEELSNLRKELQRPSGPSVG